MTSDTFRVLRRWAPILVVVTVLAAALGFVLAARSPDLRQADATLLVGQVNEEVDALRASTQLVATYADLIVSEPRLEVVAQTLGGGTTSKVVRSKVKVNFNTDTRLITVSAQDKDPARATRIINGLTSQLVTLTSPVNAPPSGTVSVVAAPQAEPAPVSKNSALRAVLAGVVGLVLAATVALLVDRSRAGVTAPQRREDPAGERRPLDSGAVSADQATAPAL